MIMIECLIHDVKVSSNNESTHFNSCKLISIEYLTTLDADFTWLISIRSYANLKGFNN